MLDRLQQQPDDPIIELLMKANADPSPNVVDLSAGVYKDEAGNTPILDAVRQAEPRRLESEHTRTYQGIIGDTRYNSAITDLILGKDSEPVARGRVSTLHTVAGSAAILLAGQLIRRAMKEPVVWAGRPTWANHFPLLKTAGVEVLEFPYYDTSTNSLMFDEMMDALGRLPSGSVVLLHGCCHNPSGADLSRDQWDELADLIVGRKLVPFIDAAYQGLGNGLEEDAYGWRLLASRVPEMLISYSCSKNFSLYRDRIGALIAISKDKDSAERTRSNMMSCSRATYSMPAAHGAFLVAEILNDDQLCQSWEKELASMRARVNQVRSGFASAMAERGYGERFGFVADQFGMFSFLGITADQVMQLREKHSVYMLESSRISVAGLTRNNLDYVADSLADVLKETD
jgi:aspartate aminotransferase